MARSDFNWVPVNHDFTVNSPTVTKEFPIEGNKTPIDDAYLLIQVRGVSQNTHQISINDKQLPFSDLQAAPQGSQAWFVWMDRIPPHTLKKGANRIKIDRIGNDNFRVGSLVVNWREGD